MLGVQDGTKFLPHDYLTVTAYGVKLITMDVTWTSYDVALLLRITDSVHAFHVTI
jgi:hypothetical protein